MDGTFAPRHFQQRVTPIIWGRPSRWASVNHWSFLMSGIISIDWQIDRMCVQICAQGHILNILYSTTLQIASYLNEWTLDYHPIMPLCQISNFDYVLRNHTTIKSTTEIGMCQWRYLFHESRCCSGIGTLLQRLAAGCGTGIGLQHIGLQHVNDDKSAKRDKPRRV